MNNKKKQSIWVVIGCCMIYAAISGMGANCRGIFYAPSASELQVSLSALTAFSTYYGISAAFCMPFCCKFYHKVPAKISITLMMLIYALSEFFMGSVQNVTMFYVLGAIQGLAGGFMTFYPMQNMIGNWFPEKKGTVLGFVVMSAGIAGMIMNPLVTRWITTYGWRTGYRILGVLMLVFGLPASLFMVRRKPETAPILQSSAKATDAAQGKTASLRVTKPRLVGLFAFLLIICLSTALTQHLPNYAASQGKTAAFGAILVSVSMLGNLLGKIVLGPMNDRLGGRITTVIAIIPVACACVAFSLSGSDTIMLIAAFFSGLTLAIIALQIPLLFRSCLPAQLYDKIYPAVCSINILVSSFSHTALSLGYDWSGSYRPVMLCLAAALCICALISIVLELHYRKDARKSAAVL